MTENWAVFNLKSTAKATSSKVCSNTHKEARMTSQRTRNPQIYIYIYTLLPYIYIYIYTVKKQGNDNNVNNRSRERKPKSKRR